MRERLGLRYRDVEELSQRIADRQKNNEFVIALSRLADIENRGTVPTMFKLYSLCAIYRLDLAEVMRWYGVDPGALPGDAAQLQLEHTHLTGFSPAEGEGGLSADLLLPLSLDPGFDIRKTTFVSRLIQKWGALPLMLLRGMDPAAHRYGFIGLDDDFMAPILPPGSFVLIDESRHKIGGGTWSNEYDRPIHFLELRDGFMAAWCTADDDRLIVQPHPSSLQPPRVLPASTVDVIGQVVGVAMRLDAGYRRTPRS